MNFGTLKALNETRTTRSACVALTELASGHTTLHDNADTCQPGLGAEVAAAIASGKSTIKTYEGIEYFINVYLPPPRLVIIGAVHIAQALVKLAQIANFTPSIIDPRTAFASAERFPNVELLPCWPDEAFHNRPLDRGTALIAVTHDPKIDDGAIQAALSNDCFYVGALGSRKTHAARVERLLSTGVSQALIDRIRAPIGLDIGAHGPDEIAVAILAEVIRSYRRRDTFHVEEQPR